MSFEIHGFAPVSLADPSAGLLILRFAAPASPERLNELSTELADAGVLEADGKAIIGGGLLAALPWRVPSAAEVDAQRAALGKISGVAEAWAFAQSAETDLADWFAPSWRTAPPLAPKAFVAARRPERVSWEGFGVAMTFSRALEEVDREIVRALAELWLSAYSDRSAEGSLGSRCYGRAVIAPRGASGVIVGLEGLVNPGSDDDATGHILWLAEAVAAVLPLADVQFMSILPQASESGETIAPAKVLERATREWKSDMSAAALEAGAPKAPPIAVEAPAATDEIETVTDASLAGAPNPDDDGIGSFGGGDDDGSFDDERTKGSIGAHAFDDSGGENDSDAVGEQESDGDYDDESWAAETKHLPRADDLLADAIASGHTNGLSTQVEVTAAPAAADAADPADPADAADAADAVDADLADEIAAAIADETPEISAEGSLTHALDLTLDSELESSAGTDNLVAALEAGDLGAAIAAYDAMAVSERPAGAEILLDVIEELDATDWDDLGPIVELGQRIILVNPERSSGHLQLIAALCRLGRGEEAIALGLAAIERPPVLFETFERLCVFRRADETAKLLPALADHGHEGVGSHYYNLGCKLHPSQPALAIAFYHGAIACGAPRPQADINLGLALISLGRFDETLVVTQAALKACGDEPNLWANLIDVQTRTDAPELEDSVGKARAVLASCGEHHEAESPSACEQGCAALISDMVDALLAKGRASDALTLISDSSGQEPAVPRVQHGKARALAISGDIDAAREILDHVATDDATDAGYYRARANVMFLAGNSDAAIGLACAAAMADPSMLVTMKRDPVGVAIADLAVGDNGAPPRPRTVSESAVWVASDREWELGGRDENGEKSGPFRYYRADGTLCNECPMVAGKPHGDFVRFHESGEISQRGSFEDGELHGTRVWLASDVTTSEQMHNDQISTQIRRSEMDYVKGRVVSVRHYNAENVLCAANGEPYPDRPGDVSSEAFFMAEESEWVAGEVDEKGQRRGMWRRWNVDGILIDECEFAEGERHGGYKAYFPDGTFSAEGQYQAGEKAGTFVYQRRGGAEHEDFPVASSSVLVAEESHETQIPGVRLYDKTGREVTIEGTPLEEWTAIYPALEGWFNEMWQVPWPELDDASGSSHRIPHLLLGLLADDEAVGEFVFRALYWHLFNDRTVYAGTAAAIPFMIELAAAPGTPNLPRLCNLIRHVACHSREALDEATESGDHAVISCNEALIKRIDVFVGLLSDPDQGVRAAAGAVLWGHTARADQMSSHLSGALASEASEMVRASHMFSLARIGTPEALFVVEAQLGGGSSLVGATAAMALVMARQSEASKRVVDRLVAALVNYDDAMGEIYSSSPWSDDDLVTEIAQALHFCCDGSAAIDHLIAAFSQIETAGGLAAIAASLMIASNGDSDGDDEDINKLLRGIADCESLWTPGLGDALTSVLEGYELPTTPEALHALADQ